MTITAFPRTFDDAQRRELATTDKDRKIGPVEVTTCAHGSRYSFRHEWPAGSGGPRDGLVRFIENDCIDCARGGWLTPGTTRQL